MQPARAGEAGVYYPSGQPLVAQFSGLKGVAKGAEATLHRVVNSEIKPEGADCADKLTLTMRNHGITKIVLDPDTVQLFRKNETNQTEIVAIERLDPTSVLPTALPSDPVINETPSVSFFKCQTMDWLTQLVTDISSNSYLRSADTGQEETLTALFEPTATPTVAALTTLPDNRLVIPTPTPTSTPNLELTTEGDTRKVEISYMDDPMSVTISTPAAGSASQYGGHSRFSVSTRNAPVTSTASETEASVAATLTSSGVQASPTATPGSFLKPTTQRVFKVAWL